MAGNRYTMNDKNRNPIRIPALFISPPQSLPRQPEGQGVGCWYRRRPLSRLVLLLLIPLLFAGCLSAGAEETQRALRIPYYDNVQTAILSEAMRQVLVEAGIPAKTVKAGSYKDMQTSLMGGTLDLYPDYTSRAWMETLDHRTAYTAADYYDLVQGYEELDLKWQPIPRITGERTLAVHINVAENNDLETLSDLADIADTLVLGADRDFLERKDGYPMFQNDYGMTFKTTIDLPESYQYKKLSERTVDVMPIDSTDGRLLNGRLALLADNHNQIPSFTGGVVIRQAVLDAYPNLDRLLYNKMRNITGDGLKEAGAMVIQNGTSVESAASYLLKKSWGEYAPKSQ